MIHPDTDVFLWRNTPLREMPHTRYAEKAMFMPVILSEAGMRAGTQTTIRHKFETDNGNKGEVWELIQTLVSGRVPASRILELFYWSQEPGALEMLRSFLGLSAQDSAALLRFFKEAEPSSVAITANGAGELVLSPAARPPRKAIRLDGEEKLRPSLKHHRADN